MKKTIAIREQIGLSQEDMATFLQVNKSTLAMYEIDKRDLPSVVKLKLAQIEQFLSQPKSEERVVTNHLKQQTEKVLQVLEQLQLVNQHQQLIVEKKLNNVEKKYNQSLTLIETLNYLKSTTKNTEYDTKFLQVLQNQARTTIEKNGLHEQVKHQVKLQGIVSHGQQIQKFQTKVKADLK